MNDTTTTTTTNPENIEPETEHPTPAAEAGLADRLRTTLSSAQERLSKAARARAPWAIRMGELPKLGAQLQAGLESAIGSAKLKWRDGIELPKRADLASLAQRIVSIARPEPKQAPSTEPAEAGAADDGDISGESAGENAGDESTAAQA